MADTVGGPVRARKRRRAPIPQRPLAVLLRFQLLVPIAKVGDNDGRQMVDQGA